MKKFIWMSPGREQIASSIRVYMAFAKFRRENPDWAVRAIKKWYERQR